MADEDQKTSTVDTETEAPDKVTDQEDPKKPEVPSAGTADAGDDDNQDEGSEDGKSGKDEGEGGTPDKTANRSAYRIRRLTSDNPRMQLLRERLQPWVEDTTDSRESKDRQRDVDDYIRDAAVAQADIERDNEQVLAELPVFTPGSDEFKPELRQRMLAQYARDMLVEDQNGAKDANGNPIIVGYRMRLIDYAREKAEDYGFGSKKPESGKQPKKSSKEAKAKMDAAADTPSGASGASGKSKDDEDPFLKGFDDPYGRHAPTNAHTWSEK